MECHSVAFESRHLKLNRCTPERARQQSLLFWPQSPVPPRSVKLHRLSQMRFSAIQPPRPCQICFERILELGTWAGPAAAAPSCGPHWLRATHRPPLSRWYPLPCSPALDHAILSTGHLSLDLHVPCSAWYQPCLCAHCWIAHQH